MDIAETLQLVHQAVKRGAFDEVIARVLRSRAIWRCIVECNLHITTVSQPHLSHMLWTCHGQARTIGNRGALPLGITSADLQLGELFHETPHSVICKVTCRMHAGL